MRSLILQLSLSDVAGAENLLSDKHCSGEFVVIAIAIWVVGFDESDLCLN